MRRSLADWLRWQEELHPREIELGLDRVQAVLERLRPVPPPGRVFTIAGTNGKGTTAHYLAALLTAAGWRVGVYTSPHLVRYNERVRVGEALATDAELVAAFEAVAAARDETPLTYFEFGTLSAFWLFDRAGLDAWVLEVGLGGRLDAVNAIDPDFSLITNVALDHQDWLGHSVEQIAAEKAGIMRSDRPAFYGAQPLPAEIRQQATALGAQLRVAGEDFGCTRDGDSWSWWAGPALKRNGLVMPSPGDDAQLANISLALAAAHECDAALLEPAPLRAALAAGPPPGRFQTVQARGRRWLLDVAHNPQAAAALAERLRGRAAAARTTCVIGLHGNKDIDGVIRALAPVAGHWVACRAGASAGLDPAKLAARLAALVEGPVHWCEEPEAALELALASSAPDDQVLVCGSFEVVGPALAWLGHAPAG